MPISQDPLILSALEADPKLSFTEAAVLSSRAWRLAYCSSGCRCAMGRDQTESFEEDIARMRLRACSNSSDLRRSRAPKGPRRHRDLDLVLEIVSSSLRPVCAGWCDGAQTITNVGYSLSAYDVWMATPVRADTLGEWSACHSLLAAWLLDRAGRLRTPYGIRLRRASQSISDGARLLESAAYGQDKPDLLREAGRLGRVAVAALLDASLRDAGLPPAVWGALMEEPSVPLTGTSLSEVLYLARAARRPVRVLAARRLAGAESHQATATLGQLLWESHSVLADTSLWALGCSDRESLDRIAVRTVAAMLQEDPAALRVPLLAAAMDAAVRAGEDAMIRQQLAAAEIEGLLREEVKRAAQVMAGM